MPTATALKTSPSLAKGEKLSEVSCLTRSNAHDKQPFAYRLNEWEPGPADTEDVAGHYDRDTQTWVGDGDTFAPVMASYTKTVRRLAPDDRFTDD